MASTLPSTRRVAVIGAGYAGLSCAVELAQRGFRVSVFEAARVAGGRARRVEKDGLVLDNGQHVLIGAYAETLRLMRSVGATPERLLQRMPLSLVFPGELSIQAARLPAPLHLALALLRARGLALGERWAALSFMSALKRMDFHLPAHETVSALLARLRQPQRIVQLLWEPLCVASLNTPIDDASAQVFANVLRDALAGAAHNSDLLLPHTDLTRLFPLPACMWLAHLGHEVGLGKSVRLVTRQDDGYALNIDGDLGNERYWAVAIATAPYHTAALLRAFPQAADSCAQIDALAWEPIVTCYLQYPAEVGLPQAMWGLSGGLAQWVFDRGRLGGPAGLLAVVISARGRHRAMQRDDLAQTLHRELQAKLPGLPRPQWVQTIVEKRATFSCRPELARPSVETRVPGLYLCGDYTASPYPATLESAVRSGVTCAASIAEYVAVTA